MQTWGRHGQLSSAERHRPGLPPSEYRHTEQRRQQRVQLVGHAGHRQRHRMVFRLQHGVTDDQLLLLSRPRLSVALPLGINAPIGRFAGSLYPKQLAASTLFSTLAGRNQRGPNEHRELRASRGERFGPRGSASRRNSTNKSAQTTTKGSAQFCRVRPVAHPPRGAPRLGDKAGGSTNRKSNIFFITQSVGFVLGAPPTRR